MTDDQPSGDELLEKLRGGYDLTEGIPPAEHDHSSVRRVEHAGHRLEIYPHYRILIDGQEFPDPIHVADDGTVHYHGIPQYSAPSAVDLVKTPDRGSRHVTEQRRRTSRGPGRRALTRVGIASQICLQWPPPPSLAAGLARGSMATSGDVG
jgi:hypothetical protein